MLQKVKIDKLKFYTQIVFFAFMISIFSLAFLISKGSTTETTAVSGLNCQKATTPVDNAICSDPELVEVDSEMNRLFELAQKGMTQNQREEFIASQGEWLRQRDARWEEWQRFAEWKELRMQKRAAKNPGKAQIKHIDIKTYQKSRLKKFYEDRVVLYKNWDTQECLEVRKKLAERIRTTPFEPGRLIVSSLGFTEDSIKNNLGDGNKESILDYISKNYKPTQEQVSDIEATLNNTSTRTDLYLEDVEQDGIKDIILDNTAGTMHCDRFQFFHVNSDKSLVKIEGPFIDQYEDEGGICWATSLGFVHIDRRTYIAVVDNFLNNAANDQPKTIIELFSLKNVKGRSGLGKIEVTYSTQFHGNLVNQYDPSFKVLEEKANALARNFSAGFSPIATSLMNNPEWTYPAEKVENIVVAIVKRDYKENFLQKESQYQYLDIENKGIKEIVCHLAFESNGSKYYRMLILKINQQQPDKTSYIDVDKDYNEQLRFINSKSFHSSYNEFDFLESHGSEYFPLSNGKECFIVKLGNAYFGWRNSSCYILGIYRIKEGKLQMVDAMTISPEFTFKGVKIL